MDWKILAASFAALVIVSSIILGGFGLGDFFSDIINTIGGFLGSSPFGGLGASGSELSVLILFYPSVFSLETEQAVNLTISPATLEMFDGKITVDYENEIIRLNPENTDLSIELPLQEAIIEDIQFSKIFVEEMDFEIISEESGQTTGTGNVEIFDFSGDFKIGADRVEFNGTSLKISVKTGDSEWELK